MEEKMLIEVEKASKSVQIIYQALADAKVEGLYNKVVVEKCQFLVIMPEISNGDIDNGDNIFIDVEEWEYYNDDQSTGLAGEVTFNYGYGHVHLGFGRNNPIDVCAKDIVDIVKGLQSKNLYAYGIITPIGSVRSGYRSVPAREDVSIKTDFEVRSIIEYYTANIYKDGMPEYPESFEEFSKIAQKLRSEKVKHKLCYVFWNEQQTVVTLFEDEEK